MGSMIFTWDAPIKKSNLLKFCRFFLRSTRKPVHIVGATHGTAWHPRWPSKPYRTSKRGMENGMTREEIRLAKTHAHESLHELKARVWHHWTERHFSGHRVMFDVCLLLGAYTSPASFAHTKYTGHIPGAPSKGRGVFENGQKFLKN